MGQQLRRLDKKILHLVSNNARIPYLEIARECGVSGAAIHQRIQKLLSLGVIKGSEFIVDTYKVGYQTCAYIGIKLTDTKKLKHVVEELKTIQEVITLIVFSIFSVAYLKEQFKWNYLVGFVFIILAVFFIFKKW